MKKIFKSDLYKIWKRDKKVCIQIETTDDENLIEVNTYWQPFAPLSVNVFYELGTNNYYIEDK